MLAQPAVAEQFDVDPEILAQIGDPAVPRRGLTQRVIPSRHLPGSLHPRELLRSLVGPFKHGADFYAGERARLGALYKGWHVSQPAVYLWHPEAVQRVLRNEDGAWSAGLGWTEVMFSKMYPHAGNSGALVTMDFGAHRDARRLVQGAFTPRAIKGYLSIARPQVDDAIDRWLRAGHVAFKRDARALLADVANEIFTGIGSREERTRIDRALSTSWMGVTALSSNPLLSRTLRRARASYGGMLAMFEGELPRRRVRPGRDLLSQLALGGDASGRDDAALARLFMSIMINAYDTTSLAVTSMAYLLARYPGWQERLRAEARSIDALDWAGLGRLEALEWAWKEALRLMPVTAYTPRRALREVELLGHRLAAGTFVCVVVGPQGRSEAYWKEPLMFDPERFGRAEDKQQPGLFAPFGGGPHACIGMQLATLEAKLVFHRMLTRCRFSIMRDDGLRHVYAPLGVVRSDVQLRIDRA